MNEYFIPNPGKAIDDSEYFRRQQIYIDELEDKLVTISKCNVLYERSLNRLYNANSLLITAIIIMSLVNLIWVL